MFERQDIASSVASAISTGLAGYPATLAALAEYGMRLSETPHKGNLTVFARHVAALTDERARLFTAAMAPPAVDAARVRVYAVHYRRLAYGTLLVNDEEASFPEDQALRLARLCGYWAHQFGGRVLQRGVRALTAREREVLACMVAGYAPARISDALVLSLRTVRTYQQAIYDKLDVHSFAAAVERARLEKFTQRPPAPTRRPPGRKPK